jgi:hypothetical protein
LDKPLVAPIEASSGLEGAPKAQATPHGFAFAYNVSKLVGSESFALAPAHELRRATNAEIALIKNTLRISDGGLLGLRHFQWEYRKEENGKFTPLPEKEWKYSVIGFEGFNDGIVELEQQFSFAQREILIAFTAVSNPVNPKPGEYGIVYGTNTIFQIVEECNWGRTDFLEVSETDMREIGQFSEKLRADTDSSKRMRQITRQMLDLQAIPPKSPLRFLGYFGILESLLTHKPKPEDPYDSITRQIKKKLALLNNRFDPRIDYKDFGNRNPEKVWSTMYAYRSSLAHGDMPDFQSDLRALGAPDNALTLLKSTVKAVIRQALIEPQLIDDLREC